jgi:thioredoxin 1
MNDKIQIITDDNFESEVLTNDKPVLVDFWAEWCGPCKALAPVLDEIANDFDGKVVIAKLNIDDNADSPVQYGVRGIPTMLLFVGGEVKATKMGALTKAELGAFLDSNI